VGLVFKLREQTHRLAGAAMKGPRLMHRPPDDATQTLVASQAEDVRTSRRASHEQLYPWKDIYARAFHALRC
jgi:hypothetical protein